MRPSGAGVAGLTPSQTVGPFLAIGLPWPDGPQVAAAGTPGAIVIGGTVFDGAGEPVSDALVETWQAAPDGTFAHPGGDAGGRFRGFGRSATDAEGRWEVVTLRPGRVAAPGGGLQAPHLDVSVFARGLLDRVVTRIYLPDEEEANSADPVLVSVGDADRRATLIAQSAGEPGRLRFDIRLQGWSGGLETVFFDV